ncbi:MAG TPA: hypothetical protein VGS05_03550 [Candidatus Sulfotelmatobacter sp.]|nr:hypothetical protein [Candidatus Sulfotelmatobacter sp.]
MHTNNKSLLWAVVLVFLGIIAIVGGTKWLALLIPAAMLIWYGAGPMLGSSRN